ncbi:hypothetical protein HGM15179_009399 [Zosterops borbonicus]|uniref:SAYSvFN domain-containing protein n=1 Tax=Zosterops borbonicus TaxID=364589 RepID=A0A8K1GGV0_9PASS|nr:hypothetical protein HGM15179_009399 [Zosterops borbonicus]
MYAGTRGPAERRPGELSAYSVFNPGCAAIAGTLTAEQLERELHYGPAAGSHKKQSKAQTGNVLLEHKPSPHLCEHLCAHQPQEAE